MNHQNRKDEDRMMANVPDSPQSGCARHGRVNCDACYWEALDLEDMANEYEEFETPCPAAGGVLCGDASCVGLGCLEYR